MTTFTTDDRIKAYQTNVEPIPFAGLVSIQDNPMTIEQVQQLLKDMLGDDPQSGIKYIVLADGSVYFFKKEGDRYALCEQTSPLQEGVQATVSSGGTRNEERS
jgi:hypothetical protein